MTDWDSALGFGDMPPRSTEQFAAWLRAEEALADQEAARLRGAPMPADVLDKPPEDDPGWKNRAAHIPPPLPHDTLPATLTCARCGSAFTPISLREWYGPPHTLGLCSTHLARVPRTPKTAEELLHEALGGPLDA